MKITSDRANYDSFFFTLGWQEDFDGEFCLEKLLRFKFSE